MFTIKHIQKDWDKRNEYYNMTNLGRWDECNFGAKAVRSWQQYHLESINNKNSCFSCVYPQGSCNIH